MKIKLKNYLLCNMDETIYIVMELNSYNMCLDYLEFIPMELFDECFEYHHPSEIANMIYFGQSFNLDFEYFKFNGYMHLVNLSKEDVEDELVNNIDEIIEYLLEYGSSISIPEDIKKIMKIFGRNSFLLYLKNVFICYISFYLLKKYCKK